MATVLPNTFQSFNYYVDIAMQHLTGDECKVLFFTARHILGWQNKINKRCGRISLSMFVDGYTYTDDETQEVHVFGGCGLSRQTVIDVLRSLMEFGLITKAKKDDGTDDVTTAGQMWNLGKNPDFEPMKKRTAERIETERKRTEKARIARENKRRGSNVAHTSGVSDITSNVAQYGGSNVAQTITGLSDSTQRNPYQNHDESHINTSTLPTALAEASPETLISTIALTPETPIGQEAQTDFKPLQEPASEGEKPPQPTRNDDTTRLPKFSKAKYYPVQDSTLTIFTKPYTKQEMQSLLEVWAEKGVAPIQGSALNADAKYLTYMRKKPRDPLFDAFAECAFGMRPGFDPAVLNGDGGRVGKLIKTLALHLERDFHDVNADKDLAQRVRSGYAQWKSVKKLAPPDQPETFIKLWNEFCEKPVTTPIPAAPVQQTPQLTDEQRKSLSSKMAAQKAKILS